MAPPNKHSANAPTGADGALALLVDSRNELGEGVLWCERSARVFWTDIEGAQLHSLHPASGQRASWPLPERLGCFAFTVDANIVLLGLASRLAWLDLRSGAVTALMPVEAALPSTRLNDGRCDRAGRFVFGTMDESAVRTAIGSFYRLNTDLTLERLPLPRVAIANSICFSVDGSAMYFCDTVEKIIYRWDGYASGDAADLHVFADGRASAASPDGAIIDADDRLWNAQWGVGRVVRYDGAGGIERSLAVAASQPSCLCLGGADFDELFVSSAWQGMPPAARALEAVAGGLFHARVAVRGVPEGRFGAVPALS